MRTPHALLGGLALILLGACGGTDEQLEQLEARVEALEQQVADADGDEAFARSVQEAGSSPTPASIDSGERSTTAEDEGGLLALAQRGLDSSTFFEVDDPEFGGTTAVGGESQVTIRLYRAGLEDLPLVLELLERLRFGEDAFEGVGSTDSTGEAVSADDAYQASWTASPEELVLELRSP